MPSAHLPAESAPKVFGLSLKDRSAILRGRPSRRRAPTGSTSRRACSSRAPTIAPSRTPGRRSSTRRRRPTSIAGASGSCSTPRPGRPRMMPATPGPQLYGAVYGSPFGNELLKDFAVAAIEAERLGQRGVTDLLTRELLVQRRRRAHLRPRQPAGAGHGGAHRSRDRANCSRASTRWSAWTTRSSRSPPITAWRRCPKCQQQRKLPGGRIKQRSCSGRSRRL